MTKIRITQIPKQQRQYSFGGNLGTNGSNFTDGLTYFNVATRHETNPNGGIPQGMAPDGQPNLVEGKDDPNKKDGGEIKWNKEEYIFSDRLKPTQRLIEKWKLPKAFLEYTYADAVRKSPVVLEAEQRPNDPKSQDVMDKFLADVADDQEQQKAEDKAAETQQQLDNMSPQELSDLNQGLEEQQAAQQEQAMQEQQAAMAQQQGQPNPEQIAMMQQGGMSPQGMPQQGAPMPQGAPMMGANGGKLYSNGGDLIAQGRDEEVNQEEVPPLDITQSPVSMVPQEGAAEMPEQGMMPEGEIPQEEDEGLPFNFDQDAEDLSTNELNGVIEQILNYAESINDRKLVRKAKKIKTASRDKKEDFVNEALDDIKEKEEQAAQEEENQRLQQPTPGDELAAQEQGPVATEALPEEIPSFPQGQVAEEGMASPMAIGNQFADGGGLTAEQRISQEALGIPDEKLKDYYWDDNNKEWLRALDGVEVTAKRPERKSQPVRIISGIIPGQVFNPLLEFVSRGNTPINPAYIQQQQRLQESQQKRIRNIRLAQQMAEDLENEKIRQQLLGTQQEINSSNLENVLSQKQFATGGQMHTFAGGGHIIYDTDRQKFRYITKDGYPSDSYYDNILKLLKGEEVPIEEYQDMYDAYNKLQEQKGWNMPQEYVGTYYTNARNGGPSNKNPQTGHYFMMGNTKYLVCRNSRGQMFAIRADNKKYDSAATKRLRSNPTEYTKDYDNRFNQNTWTVKGADGKPKTLYIDTDGNVRGADGQVDNYYTEAYKDEAQRQQYTYQQPQQNSNAQQPQQNTQAGTQTTRRTQSNKAAPVVPGAGTNSTASSPDTGPSYGYKNINGFKYWKDGAYTQDYLDFINGLDDAKLQELWDSGFLAPKGELYTKYGLNRKNKDPRSITAAMLKDKLRGAIDGKYGFKHDLAAALMEASQKLAESKAGNTGGNTEGNTPGNTDGNAGTPNTKYVIQYTGPDGKYAYSNPADWQQDMKFDNPIEGIYDPAKHTLTYAGDGANYQGHKLYVREDKPTTSTSKFTEQEAAFIRATGYNPDDITDDEQIARWKQTFADAAAKTKNPSRLQTFTRFAPLLDYAESPSAQPMANMILGTKNELQYIGAPRHGEYLTYNPTDSLYRVNQMQGEINAGRRGIMNSANGNTGMLMANLSQLNSKGQSSMGELLQGVDTENWNRKKDVINQHNQVDQTWDAMALDADKANMSNNSLIAQANRDAANLMWDSAQSQAAARNATRTNRLQTLANIGKENFAMNQVNGNPAFGGYGINPFWGNTQYAGLRIPNQEQLEKLGLLPKKDGGCLTIKRKRRRQ